MSRRWKIFLIVGLVSLLADQATKIWARAALPVTGPEGHTFGVPVEVIHNFWDWRLSHNTGSAFGLFHDTTGARIFLSIIGILAVLAIVWMVQKARDDQPRLAWALGLVVGGAIGNLIDRIAFGKVTDFVVWKYYLKEWPTFNVADVTLVVGVLLLFLDMAKDGNASTAGAGAGSSASPATQGKRKKNR